MPASRVCPLCQSSDRSILFAEENIDRERLDQFAYASRKLPEYMHHRLLLCRDCDLVYADGLLDKSALHQAYETAAFDSRTEAGLAAQTYVRRLKPTFAKLPDRCGAVDIGTGDGAFLKELLAAGFTDVAGVEPSAAPIAAASPDVRDCIRQGLFERGMFPSESQSLVTCFQTIEHVMEPLGLCQAAAEILKPGGMLCLVGHNRRSLSATILGRRSPIFDIEHLQLFSPVSMRRLLTRAGFRHVHVASFWNRYPINYWIRLFPFPARLKKLLINQLSMIGIGGKSLALPAGNLVAWGVK